MKKIEIYNKLVHLYNKLCMCKIKNKDILHIDKKFCGSKNSIKINLGNNGCQCDINKRLINDSYMTIIISPDGKNIYLETINYTHYISKEDIVYISILKQYVNIPETKCLRHMLVYINIIKETYVLHLKKRIDILTNIKIKDLINKITYIDINHKYKICEKYNVINAKDIFDNKYFMSAFPYKKKLYYCPLMKCYADYHYKQYLLFIKYLETLYIPQIIV
jgi:hypothetical protein